MLKILIAIFVALTLGVVGYWWYLVQSASVNVVDEQTITSETETGVVSEAATDKLPGIATIPADKLLGKWVSVDDAAFTRTFNADNTFSDDYEGVPEASMSGSWSTFSATDAPEDVPYLLDDDITYLKLDAEPEPLYFTVITLSETELSMFYMERGNLLNFTRSE